MARVNAYLEAGNDAGRRVMVGGRRRSDRVWAWLNTDNASNTADMRVSAEVVGPGLSAKERRTKEGDGRKSIFTVELPSQKDEHCEVHIVPHGHRFHGLVMMGAMLATIKGVTELSSKDPTVREHGEYALKTVKEIVADLEAKAEDLPHVILPGGVTLAHALACVETVKLLENKKQRVRKKHFTKKG